MTKRETEILKGVFEANQAMSCGLGLTTDKIVLVSEIQHVLLKLIHKVPGAEFHLEAAREVAAKLQAEHPLRLEKAAPRSGDVLDEQAVRLQRLKQKKALAKRGI